MKRVLAATSLLAMLLAAGGCATQAEKDDRVLIRNRHDGGLDALARVAGPGAPAPGAVAGGRPVEGRWVGEPVRVAQAAPAEPGGAGPAPAVPGGSSPGPAVPGGTSPASEVPRRFTPPEDRPASPTVVVSVRGETVYVDLGREAGAAVGQRLRVVRPGAPLVHPVTGETLGAVDDEVAVLEVTSVAEKFSTARVVSLAEGASIQPKDRVVVAVQGLAAAPAGAAGAARAGGTSPAPEGPDRFPASGGHLASATPTQELAYAIRDLAVADLDGDGRVELVAIEEFRFLVYRWTGRRLELLFEEESANRRNYIYVDAADLDGDGRAEIVLNDAFEDRVEATVLVQDGRRVVRQSLPRNHYFRVVGQEIGQPTLVGQRRGDGAQPFTGDVHRYEWRRGKARRKEAVWLPVRTSIFDFQLYRTREGSVEVAVLGASGNLRLFKGREEVWSSQGEFDGTKLRVVEKNPAPPQSTAGQEKIETGIPGRIIVLSGVRGQDGEPVPAFALRRNEKPGFLAPRWVYGKGQVLALAVDGALTRELWSTDKLEGYVAAFRVVDLGQTRDGVGGQALVMALDLQRGFLKAARSALLVYPLR